MLRPYKRRGRQVCVQCRQLAEVAHYLPEDGELQGSPQRPICPGCSLANYQAAREANRLRRLAEDTAGGGMYA